MGLTLGLLHSIDSKFIHFSLKFSQVGKGSQVVVIILKTLNLCGSALFAFNTSVISCPSLRFNAIRSAFSMSQRARKALTDYCGFIFRLFSSCRALTVLAFTFPR